MSEPSPGLQFDKAEPEAPGLSACAVCGQPLSDGYFTINGTVAHGHCKDQVLAHFGGAGGSGALRFLKASLFGFGAGLVGTVVWYVVEHVFSLQIGLVSILIGWLAGTGVSKGSNRVGGLPYQLLAVALTYVCICFAWVPDIAAQAAKPAKAEVAPSAAPTGEDVAGGEIAAAPTAEPRPIPALIRWPVAAVVSLILPFQGALGALGLLIAAFGMWEAWRRNKKVMLQVAGPFSLAGAAAARGPVAAG